MLQEISCAVRHRRHEIPGVVKHEFEQNVRTVFAQFAALHNMETYELMSGFEQPPPPLAPEMALFSSGANRSDDLFMFFGGQIGGLVPRVRYNATVSAEIATDTPSGCFGIGGAPGATTPTGQTLVAVEESRRG